MLRDRVLEDAVRIASKIGYQGMELFALTKEKNRGIEHLHADTPLGRVKKLKKLCDDLGLTVVTLCTYVGQTSAAQGFAELGDGDCEKQLEDYKRYVEMANELDCKYIRLWPGGHPSAQEDRWLRAADCIRKAADYGLSHGVGIVLETHHNIVGTVESSIKFLRMVDRPNVGLNYDPSNIYDYLLDHPSLPQRYGAEAVKALKPWIFNVQLKNIVRTPDGKSRQVLLDEGLIDYGPIVDALKQVGYDGFLSAECHYAPFWDGWIYRQNLESHEVAEHEYKEIKKLL